MKQIKKVKEAKGFTIIEVALVLAIAGLIFLVVFLALPALQNSQKDTAAKEDVGRIVSALQSYSADNQGNLPGNATSGSLSSAGLQDAGTLSQIKTVAITDGLNVSWATPSTTNAVIRKGYTCRSDGTGFDVNSYAAAVQVQLTNGTVYCANMM